MYVQKATDDSVPQPISDYLSTKLYQYLLLLLAQATDSRLEIYCLSSEHKYTSISDN